MCAKISRYDISDLDIAVSKFSSGRDSHLVKKNNPKLSKSSGEVIDDINACLEAYFHMALKINQLYYDTGYYLNKAHSLMKTTEIANSGSGKKS